MIKKLSVLFISLLFLAGCSSTKKSGELSADSSLFEDFKNKAGDRVLFPYNSSEITETAKATLAKQTAWLKEHSDISATIEGHCDERGTREYNLALGERRAEAVKKFLLNHGIDSAKIDTISYGKERPAVMGHDESAWAQNRRGVFVLRK